ncbi:MAG TPA: ABC transporter ATP-binding protein [Methylomirabilota bacterium]|nr:ABC transporter ATP-binding protein [Methylomirabilota bacterium]
MLAVKNLRVHYGKIEVLKGVSLDVRAGEIVTVIGSNGAGKTTLLRAISGLAPIVAGEVMLEGRPIHRYPPHRISRLGVAHIPQGRQIIPDLTVEDNLRLGGYRLARDRGKVREFMAREYERFPRLSERRSQIAGSLSGGEQQMLAIARGLMMDPRFVMTDEPSLGLAPKAVDEIMATLQALNRHGVTILLVEQAAAEALILAHRGYVIRTGEVFLAGPAEDLRRDPRVIEGYLGG